MNRSFIQEFLEQIKLMLSDGVDHDVILKTAFAALKQKYAPDPKGPFLEDIRDKALEQQLIDSIISQKPQEQAVQEPQKTQPNWAPVTFTKRSY